MSTPEQALGDAISDAASAHKRWKAEHGCESRCDCSVCFPLDTGLFALNEALREMGRAG